MISSFSFMNTINISDTCIDRYIYSATAKTGLCNRYGQIDIFSNRENRSLQQIQVDIFNNRENGSMQQIQIDRYIQQPQKQVSATDIDIDTYIQQPRKQAYAKLIFYHLRKYISEKSIFLRYSVKPRCHLRPLCISHLEFYKILSFLFYFGLTFRLSVYLFHTL